MSKERPKREVKRESQEAPVEELTDREAERVQGGWMFDWDQPQLNRKVAGPGVIPAQDGSSKDPAY